MSKEFGSIAMNSSAPAAIAERGAARTAGTGESKVNNSAVYKPMFSITKEGGLLPKGGTTMRRNTPTNRFSELTPFKGEASYFSQDKVAPVESLKTGTILYQRPLPERQHPTAEEKRLAMPELKHRITISDRDGKTVVKDSETLSKRVETIPNERTRVSQPPQIEPQLKKSTWINTQSHLIEQRELRQTPPSQKTETKNRDDEKINPFSTKLNQRVKAVQTAQPQRNTVNPSHIQDLESKVTREIQNQPKPQDSDNKELAVQIEKNASERMGRVITTQSESRPKVSSLSKEQAHVEIATKLQDGAVAARRMTQILESQGVEPQIARQTAVEKITQTLVKTIKDKGLDQSLELDTLHQSAARHAQPKIEMREYTDPEGHQIREKITQDEFDVITIEKEEIVAERDIVADANRIELATNIGSILLDKAQTGGASSIHTREVAELMPEEPGEALASFIRTQLNLLLDSEEQYDFFKQTLSSAGYVSNKFQVAQAAKYATDLAPAVRLSRKLTTEKVLPVDEDRAIRRGLNYSMK
jgi:hypothetical protein